ncbi:MAG: hypothetical protein Q4A05_04170 [Ruminococcus sp.]|nr:hypothetical protein [Ruminococcus sp.]
MKCLSCGFEFDDDAVYCSQCGKKIELPAAAAELAETVTETASEVKEDFIEAAAEPVETVEKLADKAEDKVADFIADIKDDTAEEPFPAAVLTDSDDTVAAIDEVLEALNSTAEPAAEEIKDTAESFTDKVEDTVGSFADKAKDKAESFADKVEDKAEAAKEAVEEKAEEVKEEVAPPEPPVSDVKPLKKREKPKFESAPAETAAAAAAAPLYTQSAIGGSTQQQGNAPQFEQQQPYAPYNEQYAAPAPADEEPAAPTKVGALRVSFAGFIAILTIIFLTLVSLLFCLRIGASGDVLRNRTKNMNINTVLDADLGKRSLSDTIYNESGFGTATDGQISKSDFRAYLAKTNLLEYTGDFVKDYADYFIEGDIGDPSVNANDMAEFFIQNSDVADESFDYQLKTSDYNKIRTTLELKDTADHFSIDKWSKKAHFDLGNLNFVFSYVTLGIILGLVIVLLVWIAVIVDGRGKHIVGMYGSIFSCSGGIVFLVGLAAVAGTAIAHIITGWFIFYLCASLLLPFGALALGVGAVEFILGFIFKRIRRGIRNSDKRNKAVEKALMGV